MSTLDNHGIIIRHLREENGMSVRKCAATIGRSIGWLSEIENQSGTAKLTEFEFERIIKILGGQHKRALFKTWIANHKNKQKGDKTLDGAVLKHIRKKKKLTLAEAAQVTGLSAGYLSKLEHGLKPVCLDLRKKIMAAYGYQPSSFKNLSTDPVKSKAVPTMYRLNILLQKATDEDIEQIFILMKTKLAGQAE